MKKSQEQWIKDRLLKKGYITRNECLRKYISRLGARICDLNAAGWHIVGKHIKTKHGRDYKYTLIKAPKDRPAMRLVN